MNWYKKAAKANDVFISGKLCSNDGYIYLKVDDGLFDPFVTMIGSNVVSPKEVTEKNKDVGAHISVIKKKETTQKIKELGEEFRFKIIGLESVKPDGWEEVKKVYFLTCDSPELENLREKYDLPKKIDNHDFHITVAVEPA